MMLNELSSVGKVISQICFGFLMFQWNFLNQGLSSAAATNFRIKLLIIMDPILFFWITVLWSHHGIVAMYYIIQFTEVLSPLLLLLSLPLLLILLSKG